MRIALSIFPLSSQTRIYGISLTVPYRFFSLFLGYFCAEEHCRPCQHLCKLFHPVVLSSWHLMTRSFSKSFDPLSPSLYSDVSIKTSYGFFFFFPSKKDCNPFSTGFSSFVSAGLKLSAHSAGTTTSACPELPKSTSWDSRGTVVIWACGMHRRRKSDTHLAKHGLLVCLARTSQAWMGTISVQRCWTHCQ